MLKPLVAIAGPTGSGKSVLALGIARRFRGEVVNCDSLQLYKGFDVGTAKISASARHLVPHHMLDVLEPSQVYSAGDYARDARRAIAGISARGNLPLIAGGTGFYLRALLEGLPRLPPRDEVLRERLMRRDPVRLHRLLGRLDPEAARRIHARDTQKTIRALEIRVLTRQSAPAPSLADPLHGYRVLKLGLDPDRAELYAALDARTREMFRGGLIEEVQRLLASGCTGEEKPFESLGYKQALAYLRGSASLDGAIEQTRIETRQYAKRQWTWFRRDAEIQWVRGFGHSLAVLEHSCEIVKHFLEVAVS